MTDVHQNRAETFKGLWQEAEDEVKKLKAQVKKLRAELKAVKAVKKRA